MSASVTSLFDIASMVQFQYGSLFGTKGALPSDEGVWIPLPGFTSPISTNYANNIAFSAGAYENETTHEIVIVFRGTVPTSWQNLAEDGLLGLGGAASIANPILVAADEYAQAVAKANPDATITLTGHSLGGYLAQAATVNLLNSGLLSSSAQASLSTVTFNAPGLPAWLLLSRSASSYTNAYNFNTQGDIIHLFGGTQIGQSTTVAVGPTASQEWDDFGSIFTSGDPNGTDVGLNVGAADTLYNDWINEAHAFSNFIGTNTNYNNQPGLFTANPTLGADTAAQFFQAGQGISPSPLISVNSSGAMTLSDGSGDSFSLTPSGATSFSASLSVASGTNLGAANVAGLESEAGANNPSTFSSNLLDEMSSFSKPGSTIYSLLTPGYGSIISGAPIVGNGVGQIFVPSGSDNGDILFNVPTGVTASETVAPGSNVTQVVVNSSSGLTTLSGGQPETGTPGTWLDSIDTRYTYVGDSTTGQLVISNGSVGAGNSITIESFNISVADSNTNGFLGIKLPETLTLTADATDGLQEPATFTQGSSESYTLTVGEPCARAQTITVTLSGAASTDFDLSVNGSTETITPNDTFTVQLAADQENVTFSLQDTTADNGSSDLDQKSAGFQLSASMLDLTASAAIVASGPLNVSYVLQSSDTAPSPQTNSVVTGSYNSVTGITTYTGDGANDYIDATGSSNLINAQNSGNDSIFGGSGTNTINGSAGNNVIQLSGTGDQVYLGSGFNTVNGSSGHDTIGSYSGDQLIIGNGGTDLITLGNGTNQIYALTQTSLATAIATASSGTPTHAQGDLITVQDGDNTIVGGDGNDFYAAGAGNDVIVMGPGSDTFVGGQETYDADANWSISMSNGLITENQIGYNLENYQNSFLQPYWGNSEYATGQYFGPANDTVYGGTGNDFIDLGNGSNYVETGSGNDTVYAGMGENTVIAGSGNDFVNGGGGTEYIEGGAGHDTLIGSDGSNTIIGGSGNSTIYSSAGPGGVQFTNASLDQNYVDGGSGNDVIYGSAGQDMLIAGTGNTTIYGQFGQENIVGGSGNDLLIGGTGNNTLSAGGSGVDTLDAGGSSTSTSYLYGGDGKDYIVGASGANILNAGDGGTAGAATSVYASQTDATATTTITGGMGVDYLEAGSGSAVIYAGDGGTAAAPTTLIGWTGSDTLTGGSGTDLIIGGTGPTEVLYAGDGGTSAAPTSVVGGTGVDTLVGGAGPSLLQDTKSGEDLLVSATADDTMIGVGSDTLVAGTGNEAMQSNGGSIDVEINAGFGNDTVIYNGGTTNLLLGSGINVTDFIGSIGFDSLGNSSLVLSGDGGSIAIEGGLTGDLVSAAYADPSAIPLATLLTDAFGGDQTVASGSANFLLNLGNAESISAGTADDTISSWGNNVSLTGALFNQIFSTGSAALISSSGFDSIVATGNFDTVGGGQYGGDTIVLTGGNSIASVGSNFDGNSTTSVTASGANDTVNAASGTVASIVTVNSASTVINVSTGAGAMTVDASVSYTAPTNVSTLTLVGSGNISATGNTTADVLTGGVGVDTLFAGSGIDTMKGGLGNTTFVINSVSDVVQDTTSTANNTLESSVSYTLPTDINNLILTGSSSLVGSANSGNDTLTSNTGIDTLVGGSGHDTFILNNAADVVEDTAGSATIVYAASVNFTLPANVNTLTLLGSSAITATGNSGNDSIMGNAGADTLIAGSSIDTLVAGPGSAIDSLVAGSGNDLFVVDYSGDLVTVGATHGTDTVQSSVSYTLPTNVSALLLTGTSALSGTGNSTSDMLIAGSGADTLTAGSGVATLVGGAGNDTFVVNSTSDVVQDSSSSASNTILSSANYTLATDVTNLVLTGTAALTGTAGTGNDTLTSNSGADTLVGGASNDLFVINNSSDIVTDTSTAAQNIAQASVSYTLPTDVNTLILTGTAALTGTSNGVADSIVGNAGADTLVAQDPYDTLVAGAGTTTFVLNAAYTTAVINSSSDVIEDTSGFGHEVIESSLSYTLPTSVTTLELIGSSNLTGAATSGNNSLVGNAGNDILSAGAGSDTLVAGAGSDTLVGGSGADTFVINNASDVLLSVSTAAGNTVISSVTYSLAANVSNLTLEGSANLVGTGNNLTNTIVANSGNDTLIAGSGVAHLDAGVGSDLFVVNSASDVVFNSDAGLDGGIDTIQSSVSYTLPTAINILQLTGTANLNATGNTAADSLIGNAGNDSLMAGIGDDTIIAGTGIDTLVGGTGSGNETFVVDNASDAVLDSVSSHNNIVYSSVSYSAPLNVNTMIFTGSASIVGTANSANDLLEGNSGNDSLVAGAGNDTLNSGLGVATLVGGAGNDTFIVSNSADVIQSASASSQNALFSSATYTLPTNINVLTLTGAANVAGTGNAAADTLTAGAGQDTLTAGSGAATLIGGAWNDTFVVNSTGDVVEDSSTAASNTIQSSVNYTLVTNVNTLLFTGTAALQGAANSGNDTLISNTGLDTLIGGSGSDSFVINNSSDVVQDTATAASNAVQASVNYTLAANVNTLTLTGTSALTGTANSGNDTLISNTGLDTLVGGSGNDTFVVNNALDVVQDTSTSANNTIQSEVSYTLVTNVNTLTLTGTAALSGTGNGGSDTLTANSGADTLTAGSGVATLVGGSGSDTFVVNSTSDVVKDSATAASNTILSSVNYTLPTDVTNLVLMGTSALVGTAGSGSDTLTSNTGVDTLVGGSGADVFIVNNTADVVQGWNSNDTLESSVNYTLPTGVSNIVLLGTANLMATGNATTDTLIAGGGTDTLIAGSGAATLIGGAGNDTFVVNSASDVVQDTNYTSSNAIESSVSYSLPTDVDTLILTGSSYLTATGNQDVSNVITANSGNDLIVGNAYENTLYGGTGSDTIDAGSGSNVIYAGNGGTTAHPTYIYGNATNTNVATQSTIYGGSGTDVIYGGPGSDAMYAGSGIDTLIGGTGFDSIYGSAGSYIEDSVSGYDYLAAGAGAETLTGAGDDTWVGGTGTDVLNFSGVGISNEVQFNSGFGQESLAGTYTGINLEFGTGIEPSNLSIGTQTVSGSNITALELVLHDGAGAISIAGGLYPSMIGSMTFADTGSETLAQLMNLDDAGTATIADGTRNYIVSAGNDQTITASTGNIAVYAFGSDDQITSTATSSNVYAYGNDDTVTATGVATGVLLQGSGDQVSVTSTTVTLVGAADSASGTGSDTYFVYQNSDVITQAAGSTQNYVTAYTSYTLPTYVQSLTLAGSSLSGASNAQGGSLVGGGNYDTLTGGSGSDTLIAEGNGDSIIGGSGAETYVLESSTDSVQFGSGNASLNALQAYFSYTLGSAVNTLTLYGSSLVGAGNSGNDSLTAYGSSTLIAGTGADTLSTANTGYAEVLVGGSGNDTFIVSSSGDIVEDASTTSSNTLIASCTFTLPTNVNSLILSRYGGIAGVGNSGNDSMVATASNETLTAGSGADTLVAESSDYLVAGGGQDVLEDQISGSSAATFVFDSGFGNDQVVNAHSADVIQFGAGISEANLTFTAVPGNAGATASVVISGYGSAVTLQGGLAPGAISSVNFTGGSDYTLQQLLDPSGRVTIPGSNGNLILTSSNGDSLVAGSGQDTVIAWGNNDTLNAGTGGTVIYAEGTSDRVIGGAATDSLIGYGANTTLVGGGGQETLIVENTSTVVTVSAGIGHDTVLSSVSYTVPNNVSVLTLTGTASLTATGNASNDLITGNAGGDVFIAGAGVDTLIGNSTIPGSISGYYDTFYVNNVNDVVQPSSIGGGEIVSTVSYSMPANASILELNASNLVGIGNNQNDNLNTGGNGGLGTGGSYDTLVSGGGIDTLATYGYYNVLVINNSADVIVDLGTADTIESSVSETLSGGQYDISGDASNSWNLTGSANIVADDQNAGNLRITGNTGNDTLIAANGGSDVLVGGGGVDTLIGGSLGAANTFIVNNASDVVVAPSSAASNVVDSSVSYSLPANVGQLYLTTTGISAIGSSANGGELLAYGADSLIAGSGNETLTSALGHGSNTLVAGAGNDVLSAYAGDTLVFGSGFGNSTIEITSGGTGLPTVEFGAGISPTSISAQAVIDSTGQAALALTLGGNAVTLNGALSNHSYQFNFNGGSDYSLAQFLSQVTVVTSSVAGASGNAILEGTPSVSIAGGSGNDTIYAAASGDTVTGGSGNQSLNAAGTADSIVGGSGTDTLSGFGTNDTLTAGTSAETLVGGTGATVDFVISSTSDAIQLQSTPGIDTVTSSIAFTLPTNINMLVLAGTSALQGTANSGSDTLISNAALDTLVGSSGNDYFIVNNASDVITDTSTSAHNTLQTGFSFTLPTNVNSLILTGTGALVGTGNGGADTLTSNSGVDTLYGGAGNDIFILNNAGDVVQDTAATTNTVETAYNFTLPTDVNVLILTGTVALTAAANSGTDSLTSNSGVDTLVGGSGNDTFVVNNSLDVITDTATAASNAVQSSVSYTLPTNVNSLTLTGTAALIGTANSGTDTLTANTGADTLYGGAGNDTFVVLNSADVIADTSSTSTNTAKSSVSYTLATNVNILTLTGSASITGTANAGNDSLTGNSGTDTLTSGAGSDTLIAGTGVDTLVGGTGNTTFVINAAGDVVEDATTTSTNIVRSTVSYILPTNVNALLFTGASALTGTANAGNDTLTSNTGADTLVGEGGNDTFVISSASDVIEDTSSTSSNVVESTATYTMPTDVNTLILTGSTALQGTGNAGNDSMVANTGADTLSAGNGTDTLVSSASGGAVDSLVGGTGNDLFIVSYTGDIVTVGATHGADTIDSSASYTASANIATLVLTGTSNLSGTGNSLAGTITANTGNDTLTAGAGVDTLVGGSGNDTFVINSGSDVVQDTSSTSTNVISSSASYTLPTDVTRLILTGTFALAGTAGSGNDTLTANSGADTLTSGTTGTDSLVGGTGADLFFVNNTSDIVNVGSTHGVDTISSSVSYTASTNVADLTLTGTSALAGTGNSLAGTLTANSGADTLTAGTGADTLVGSNTGTDIFVVNSASDIVSVGTSGLNDTIESSASYTLPTNVQYLTLTGTSALSATGNSALDLLIGNTGKDTLTGGTGIAALEGGRTAGSDQIKAASNQAALIAGGGSSTLTGGAYKDFYAAGLVSDTITTGATANVVSVNKGDGATTLAPTTSATNVLSLGDGIDTESLEFTKSGNNLVLSDGVSGDSITFTNWYSASSDQDYTTLQVIEIASPDYNSGGGDPLRDKPIEAFNFTALVSAYIVAGSPTDWALSNDMSSAALTTSASADYGGDLAYYFGLNGNLTGVDLSDVSSVLTNSSYGTGTQAINSFGSISGGGGLQLLVKSPGAEPPIATPSTSTASTSSETSSSGARPIAPRHVLPTDPQPRLPVPVPTAPIEVMPVDPLSYLRTAGIVAKIPYERLPTPQPEAVVDTSARMVPRFGLEDFTALVTRAAEESKAVQSPKVPSTTLPKSYVDPITVAWATMHGRLDQITEQRLGGTETPLEDSPHALEMLASTPITRLKSTVGDQNLHNGPGLRRAM